jgi:hypothetical protein
MRNNVQPAAQPQRTACGARRPGWDQGPAIGRHRIPCVLDVGHDDDHRDAFGKSWTAAADAPVMRVDAPQVNGARVHTIRLHDVPGATLTVACPEWCVSDHRHDVEHGVFAADLTHIGEAVDMPAADDTSAPIMRVRIWQTPFSSGPGPRHPVAALDEPEQEMDPEQLCALAEQLRTYADALDELSVELDDARRTAHKGDR